MKRNDYFSLVYIVYTALQYIYSDLFFLLCAPNPNELDSEGEEDWEFLEDGAVDANINDTEDGASNIADPAPFNDHTADPVIIFPKQCSFH